MKFIITVIFFCSVMCIKLSAQYNYPISRTVDSSDTYFGHTYKDPYRWMENYKDTEMVNWFQQQNRFTDSVFTELNGVDSLLSSLNRYMNSPTWGRDAWFATTTGIFYTKTKRGQLDIPVYFKSRKDTAEQLLFNTWTIQPGMRYQLSAITASPDEKYLLVAFDKNGEEYPFIKIMNLATRKWLPDSIPHCWPNTINWTADSKGFIYGCNLLEDRTRPDASNYDVVKYHLLNTSAAKDVTVMDNKLRNRAEKKISNSYYANLHIDNSKRRIYLEPNQGFEFEYNNSYYCNSNELLNPNKKWNLLYSKKDSVYGGTVKESENGYYFISAKGNGFKSLRFTPFAKPDFANAKILLPEDNIWQLEGIDETLNYLIAKYSKYGFLNRTVIINKKTNKPVNISALAAYDRFAIGSLGKKTDECIFFKRPVNRPGYVYLFDIANNKLMDDPFWAPQNQTIFPGSDDIITELIEVPSYDGTLVPMSIMRNKNTPLNGDNVCILYGYGAYGITIKDNSYNEYSPINNALVQKGVILAHAYIRGGGEKGEQWHKAGMKENKPNTWKDFIACAEYLTKNGYTNPARLGCEGGSAGGILIGRTVEERPELFAAAVNQVGAVNQIRGKAWANMIGNYGEYGNPEIESEMKGLIEMDAVIHVKPQTKYPAMYITTGMNDTRVAPWMPAKLAASFQAASTSGKPVLLYSEFEGGHGGYANAGNIMDLFRKGLQPLFFLLWQCGHSEFQKK